MKTEHGAATVDKKEKNMRKLVAASEFSLDLQRGDSQSGALGEEMQPQLKPLVGVLRTKRANTPSGDNRSRLKNDSSKADESEVAKKGRIDDEILDIITKKDEDHDYNGAGQKSEGSNYNERDRYLKSIRVLSEKARNKHTELPSLVIEGALTTTQLLKRPQSREMAAAKSGSDGMADEDSKEKVASNGSESALVPRNGVQECKLPANDSRSRVTEAKDDELSVHSSIDSIPADAGVFAQPSVTILQNTAPTATIFISSKEQDANDAASKTIRDGRSKAGSAATPSAVAGHRQRQHQKNAVGQKGCGPLRLMPDSASAGMAAVKEEGSGALSDLDDELNSPELRNASSIHLRPGSKSSRSSTPTFTRDATPHEGESEFVALTGHSKPITDSPLTMRRKSPSLPGSPLVVVEAHVGPSAESVGGTTIISKTLSVDTDLMDLQSDLYLGEGNAVHSHEGSLGPGDLSLTGAPTTEQLMELVPKVEERALAVERSSSPVTVVVMPKIPSPHRSGTPQDSGGPDGGAGFRDAGKSIPPPMPKENPLRSAARTSEGAFRLYDRQPMSVEGVEGGLAFGVLDDTHFDTEGHDAGVRDDNGHDVHLRESAQQKKILDTLFTSTQSMTRASSAPDSRHPPQRHMLGPFKAPGCLSPDPAARFQHVGAEKTLVESLQPGLMTFSMLMDMGSPGLKGGDERVELPQNPYTTAHMDSLSTPKHYNREKQHYDDYSHRLTKAKTELDMMEVRRDIAFKQSLGKLSTKLARSQSELPTEASSAIDATLADELEKSVNAQMRRYKRLQSHSRDVESERILAREARRKEMARKNEEVEAVQKQKREARFERGWLTGAKLGSVDVHDSVHDGLTVAEMSQVIEGEASNHAYIYGGASTQAQAQAGGVKDRFHALYQSSEDTSAIAGSLRTDKRSSGSQQSCGPGVSSDSLVGRNQDLSGVYLSPRDQIQETFNSKTSDKHNALHGNIGVGVSATADRSAEGEREQVSLSTGDGNSLGEGVQLLQTTPPESPDGVSPTPNRVSVGPGPLGEGQLNENSFLTTNTGRLQDSVEMGAFVPSHSSSGPGAALPHDGRGGSLSHSHSRLYAHPSRRNQSKGTTLPKELPRWYGRKLGESVADSKRARAANETLASTKKMTATGIPEKHYQPERSVMKPTVWKYDEVPVHVVEAQRQSLQRGGDLFRSTLAGSMIIEGHLDELSLSTSFMRVPSVHGKVPPTISRSHAHSTVTGRSARNTTSKLSSK